MPTTQDITTLNANLNTAVQSQVAKVKALTDDKATLVAENAQLKADNAALSNRSDLDPTVLNDFIANVNAAINTLNPA